MLTKKSWFATNWRQWIFKIEIKMNKSIEINDAMNMNIDDLIGVLIESSQFIYAVHNGKEPITRYPLVDELDGFSLMLHQYKLVKNNSKQTQKQGHK